MESHPSNLDPANYGWYLDNGEYKRVMSESPITPSNILERSLCACEKSRCSSTTRGSQCSCRVLGEVCTDRCRNCENCDVYVEEPEDNEQFVTSEHI